MPSFLASSAILASTLFSVVRASSPSQSSAGQSVAVYWGQGPGQKPLASFCADSTIDIIPIAFVNVFPDESGTFGYPGTNFGNACGGYFVDPKNETTQLLGSCPQIGADITYCQSQGKKVLLSLGGGSTGVFIASDDSAKSFGDFLYGAFGPASSSWTGPRPFGSASVDGFDFDIEATASSIPTPLGYGYATMVNHLRTLGTMMITASPQCIVPDANLGDALTNAPFDAIFVQFYNTPQCSARAYFDDTYGAYGGSATSISYDAWISWMQANSNNPDALVYLGLPASPDATFGEMYLNTTEAQEILTHFQGKYPTQFGGAMVWEATYSDNNQVNGMSYAANVKCFLAGSCGASSTTTSSVSSSTPTSSSSSSTVTSSSSSSSISSTAPSTSSSTTLSTSSSTASSSTFSSTPANPYSATSSTSPIASPISTGGFPGSISATGSGYSTGGSSGVAATTIPSSITLTSTSNTYTGSPTGTSSVPTVTTTDVNGVTYTYTPTQDWPSSTVSAVTTTDRNGNTFTYTPTSVQATGSSGLSTPTGSATDHNGHTFTYTPTQGSTSSSSTISPATTTDRNGNTFTYTPTSIQPLGTSTAAASSLSSLSTTVWTEWDPSSTSTFISSTTWAWDPSTSTASPISTSASLSSTSTSWTDWDPSTTSISSSATSSPGWALHSTQTYETTITASDAKTLTIMPLPVSPISTSTSTSTSASPSIASLSSYWTQRAPASSASITSSSSTHAAPTAASSSSSSAWIFTGWSSMPSYTTLAPLPSIATVTASAATSAGAVVASASPSVSVYVQPGQVGTFTGAGHMGRPVFGFVVGAIVGAVAMLL